jgi:PAS domain S-box-containing protein
MIMLTQLWDALTVPAQAIASPGDRREARLLSSVLLLIIAIYLATVGLVSLPFTAPPRLAPAYVIAALIALGCAYGLSRTRYLRAAVAFTIALLLIVPFVLVVHGVSPPDSGLLTFLLVGLLVASLFVSIRTAALLAALMAGAMAVVPILTPEIRWSDLLTGPVALLLLASGVHLLARRYHSGLNRERLQELLEIEHRYRALSEASDDGIALLDLEGKFLGTNRRLADMLGTLNEELVGGPFASVMVPEEAPDFPAFVAALRKGEVLPPQERTLLTSGGLHLPVDISTSVVHNGNGDPAYAQLIVRDTSTRRAERDALQRRHRGLMVLNRIISATTTTVDEPRMLHALCGELAYAFGLRHVYAAHVDRHANVAVVTADYASAGVNRLLGASVPLETPILAHVLIYRTILLVESPHTDPRMGIWERSLPKEREVSLLLVPLLVRDRVVSILGMELPAPITLSAQDVELIQSSASAVAQALETAELYRRLEQRADELEEMVEHRTLELQEALAQAQAADRAKSQFVSNVSHELRTPLTSIRLYLDLANRGRPERIKSYVAALIREAARLQHLVESLLMVSRLDLGSMQLDCRPVDLNEAVTTLVSDRQTLFGDHNLTLAVEAEPSLAPIQADPRLIEQVLTNLLTNAMNYTPEGGAVTLRTGTALVDGQRWATVSVEDTGMGIPREELGRLFRRFERGQASAALQVPGTGLGLAISKEIIDLHRGRITVDSTLGKGSVFVVWLPLNASGWDEETDDTRPLEA